LSYASSGTGNATHLSMALLEMMTKIELNHIPYKGTGQGITDVMGGHVPLMFGALPSTLPGVKAGKLKILAISSASRSPVLPDVPTVAEAGVPGYELTSWYGVLAPAGTPAAIVGQLNGEIVKALHTPDVKARLTGEGAEPVGDTAQQFQAFIRRESTNTRRSSRRSASAPASSGEFAHTGWFKMRAWPADATCRRHSHF
jgi:tripartite-type tricarboxylate transporter receptor subunit TctC